MEEEVDNLLNLVDIKSEKVGDKELKLFEEKEEFLMQEEIDKLLID
jgi:hypothetical protein